jgi:hypothetical protein
LGKPITVLNDHQTNIILEDVMHPTLQAAFDKAEEVLLDRLSGEESPTAVRAKLEKLTKAQLIDELMALKVKKMKDCKVEDLVYAVMCTPECAPLSYAMIASIVVKHRPGKTNEGNIRWYASKALEKGVDTVPRITQKALNQLILESLVA